MSDESGAAAATSAEVARPAAPAVYTPWIWLVALLPIVGQLPLLLIDYPGLVAASLADQSAYAASTSASLALIASPGYLLASLSGWLVYLLCVLFAYLDWKALLGRGISRPFHWAWTFLYSPAYVIGRSVVVRRRTGSGIAPMWVAIVGIVIAVGVAIYIVVITVVTVIQVLVSYSAY
jgi:hypothetical protein